MGGDGGLTNGPQASGIGRRPTLSFGPLILGSGQVRFRLWAPAAKEAVLELMGEAPRPMRPRAGGWFDVEAPAEAGALYRFRLGELVVPDPAARAMQGDVHGWSVLVDTQAFAWNASDWRGRAFEEAVFYEAHPGLFGGFSGLAAHVPALAELGVTALELMPVGDFPGRRNWGYDGVLIYAPDAAYGTPQDLQRLVEVAHAAGLMVFLDVVYNHFGPDGNYLPAYAPSFFRDDKVTAWGGAVDVRTPEVRRFFIENALYWLSEYRLDGLRLDAVHAIGDSGFLEELAAEARTVFGPDRPVHLVVENDDNEADLLRRGFDAQWNDDFHHVLHVLLTGESAGYYRDYIDRPMEKLARALTQGFVFQGEAFQSRDGAPRGSPSGDLRPTAFVNFLQNHDQIGNRALGERLTTLADPQALEAAIGLLLLSPAPPLIFMGEEDGAREPFLFFTDHEPELAEKVREGRRLEFKGFAAFADPQARETIPDPNAQTTFERSRPTAADPERHALYRRLLAIRHERLVPRLQGAAAIGSRPLSERALAASWRLGDGAELTLAVNLGPKTVTFTAPAEAERVFELRAQEGGLGPYGLLALITRS